VFAGAGWSAWGASVDASVAARAELKAQQGRAVAVALLRAPSRHAFNATARELFELDLGEDLERASQARFYVGWTLLKAARPNIKQQLCCGSGRSVGGGDLGLLPLSFVEQALRACFVVHLPRGGGEQLPPEARVTLRVPTFDADAVIKMAKERRLQTSQAKEMLRKGAARRNEAAAPPPRSASA
jgi:hypothetical protein